MKTIFVADHFCGAGGTSTGVAQACKKLGINVDLLAVNHWQVAIDTHTKAHPWARHVCATLTHVKPREVVPGGRLHLLVASPECTNHSIAKGGRPKDEQSRATAWDVLKWAQELYVDNILIENVKEFRKWGPLGANGKPLRSKEGETYRAFLDVLRAMGYRVEDRVLNCADFGAPTSRERLFIIARRGGKQIKWPEPTHSRTGRRDLFGPKQKYRAAREVIDWDLPNPSIFDRKRPLKPNTMRRILAGLEKFNPHLQPFITTLRQNVTPKSVDEPLPTVTAGGTHLALCEPIILGQQTSAAARSTDQPLPTVATAGAISLTQPVLVKVTHGAGDSGRPQTTDKPLPSLTTKNGIGVTEAFIVPFFGERNGQNPRSHSVDESLPTVTGHGAGALVEPVLVVTNHGDGDETRRFKSVNEPLPTQTTSNSLALVEPVVVPIDHTGSGDKGARSVDQTLSTITTENRHGLAEAFLTKYYGTATSASVEEPLDAVTTKDRFGLVQPEIDGYRLDIRFRMLQPHELAAAMTFPKHYPFSGTKSDVTKQIGNAVPVLMAEKLVTPLLEEFAATRKGSNVIAMEGAAA